MNGHTDALDQQAFDAEELFPTIFEQVDTGDYVIIVDAQLQRGDSECLGELRLNVTTQRIDAALFDLLIEPLDCVILSGARQHAYMRSNPDLAGVLSARLVVGPLVLRRSEPSTIGQLVKGLDMLRRVIEPHMERMFEPENQIGEIGLEYLTTEVLFQLNGNRPGRIVLGGEPARYSVSRVRIEPN